ncbi:RNA-binding protein 34-like [Ceratina calcarata]|uniref:RNA-binding protein 34-like n=1 Tax=Ceratina calcarata TaxID=156304 RepID=A0AAJ7J1A6_9HYME|nr:RNA-binding protein 34-like [Ceratina calcarata]
MVKSLTMEGKSEKTKNSLNTPKKGFVEKKKKQKFKEVPTGKVALINGSKVQNNKQNLQTQKGSPQKSPKGNKTPQGANKNSKKDQKKKNAVKPEEEEDDTDSDEEINEGVELDSSMLEDSDDDLSEEESGDEEEIKVPNILGASLADDTDEDDDDFEEQEELSEKKGVKMFKGVNKSADSSKDSSAMEDSDEDDEDDDDEEEEDDDDDESDEETEGSSLGLKALMSNSIAEDDEDDEDFVEAERDDDDDDMSSEEEDEEEEDEEQNSPTNPNKGKNSKGKKDGSADVSLEELKEDKKTIFVGNLPTTVTKKQLMKLFKKFGEIDTIRLRGMVPKELSMSKKVAAITKNVHPKIKSVYAYIRFVNIESVKAALSLNDTEFEGNHLRVDAADKSVKYDQKKSVFLGNLNFNIEDNAVRKHFEQCGEIESVRVVRDGKTRIGKGFGYVNFKNADSVALALELDGTMLQKREVRVKPNLGEQKSKDKGKRSLTDSSGGDSPQKKSKIEEGKGRNKKNAMKRLAVKGQKQGGETSPQQSKAFQGQKADANKKKKNKVDKKKKVIAEKLTAKPKKPSN